MARVTHVAHARKSPGPCGRCGAEIRGRREVDGKVIQGDPYKHASPGFRSSKLVRCDNCSFRQSELTTSLMAGVYAAQEGAHDALDALDSDGTFTALDDVESILSTAADEAAEVQGEYEAAAEAMGSAGEEHQERADMIESWADDLGNVTYDDPPEDEESDETEEEWQSWREGVIEAAREAIDAFEG